jgi:hypothetical protein
VIPVELAAPGAAVFVALIAGWFAWRARKDGTKKPLAATYTEMWSRMDLQDEKIEEISVQQRVMGDGFDAFYNANSRSHTPLHFTANEQRAVNAARRLRTGEGELVG